MIFTVLTALPPAGAGAYCAEFDIDLGNPLQDVTGFLVHVGEVLGPKKTDHLGLYKKLAKDKKIKPFLGYKIESE